MADKDFTQREMEIMAKAWCCMTQEPKVDYDKLSTACGMTNPRSASNAWAKIKIKILSKGDIPANGNDKNGANDGGATPKKSSPNKRSRAANGGDDEESPTKKTKGKGKKKGVKAEDDDEENEKVVKSENNGGAEGESDFFV